MPPYSKKLENPKIAIIYAYVITSGSILGLIFFGLIYFTNSGLFMGQSVVPPIVFSFSVFIFSGLGLLTGSGLLFRKKYGWILAQFILIYILVRSIYKLLLITLLIPVYNPSPILNIFIFLCVSACCGLLIMYFNQKPILKYYGLEREDASRIYVISLLTCAILMFYSNFI